LQDQGGDISILFCPFIEGLVILDRSKLFILLSDVEESGTIRGFGILELSLIGDAL
jgi:hypothetical protein